MQGGISNGSLAPDLMSLGRIDHQIFWLFYPAGETLTDLAQLKGKRIGLGAEGSGDRAVCEKILAVAGITYDNTTLVTVAPENVINNLDGGAIDAIFRNFSPESPVLDALLRGPQYRLMNFAEAEALTRIFPYLVRLVLPKGAIDLARKMPVSDTALIATTNVLLARKDIHPAVVDLLAQDDFAGTQHAGAFSKGWRISYRDRSGISHFPRRPRFLQKWSFVPESVPAFLDDKLRATISSQCWWQS